MLDFPAVDTADMFDELDPFTRAKLVSTVEDIPIPTDEEWYAELKKENDKKAEKAGLKFVGSV